MDICDWLDLDNMGHLAAIQEWAKKGIWPEDFIPDDITFRNLWHVVLMGKITDKFLSEKLGN